MPPRVVIVEVGDGQILFFIISTEFFAPFISGEWLTALREQYVRFGQTFLFEEPTDIVAYSFFDHKFAAHWAQHGHFILYVGSQNVQSLSGHFLAYIVLLPKLLAFIAV